MSKYAIGIDYGTLSVRALLVDIETGKEVAASIYEYPHGVMEEHIPSGKKLPVGWALQDPQDYLEGLLVTVRDVVSRNKILPGEVVGIGVDFTSSTVIPVKADKTPLCHLPEFKEEPHAYVKLWKHHGAEEEAKLMNDVAVARGEEWLEAGDWIIWQMTGEETRSACCAGYKAYYHHEKGYPSKDFFKAVDPRMENIVEEKLDAPIKGVGEKAGHLTASMAREMGLMEGVPVATCIIDAHASLPGCGIGEPGKMMIIVGTSSVHMMLGDKEAAIKGSSGTVKDGIMPGYFGYEAGQSCVGDHFAWFVENCVPESYEQEARVRGISIHQLLSEKLSSYKAGASGLLALDWFNGVRTPLMDFNLNGLIMGMNLLTKPEEIYLSLIEATAYGTRMIIEGFEEAGLEVKDITLSGGIPIKNEMLVQVYSDVCNRKIKVVDSTQSSALGAAILGAAAAPERITGFKNANEAAKKLGKVKDKVWEPNQDNVEIYNELYEEYKTLHGYFGTGINDVMKHLNNIRERRK
jgi:L-ribulokinase